MAEQDLATEEPKPSTEEPGQRAEDLKLMKTNYLHHDLLMALNDQLDDSDEQAERHVPEEKEDVQCLALGEMVDD